MMWLAIACIFFDGRRTLPDKSNRTRVLFMHCPPVNQPCSPDEVTDAIKQIIVWVCEDGGSDS
ncbi:hypothetical protein DFS33DRAFT_1285705 [Desarmillaria ectypa]|nr:hypothetical protein DFS33DRAFT_1285705 [Desarmillaria ectypa]